MTGWPTLTGTWTVANREITLTDAGGPAGLFRSRGAYAFTIEGSRVHFALGGRRLHAEADDSRWQHLGAERHGTSAGRAADRRHVRGHAAGAASRDGVERPAGRRSAVRWASGVADGQHLPDRWNPSSGEAILWRTAIPGLAHSSPVVWGDLVFVTSAISSRADATFKPGLYGDGDASDDRVASPLDALRAGSADRPHSLGARRAPKASRGTSATSSRPTRARRRPPTGALSSPGSARRASSPTT